VKFKQALVTVFMILSILMSGCGGDKKDASQNSGFFPAEFTDLGAARISEPQTFAGESLYEYINGGAELYHLYNFVDVTTASYDLDGVEIVVDIYQFDTPANAYGLYTLMRPQTPVPVDLGVEGFSAEPNIDFIKGQYMVRLIGFDFSSRVVDGIQKLSRKIESLIPGQTSYPEVFTRFPTENKIAYTDKIQADSYLGYGFLSRVTTQDYLLGEDTVTLFLTADDNGNKYVQFMDMAVIDEGVQKALEDIPFESGQAVILATSYYGEVMAGLRNGLLLGVVNYNDSHKDFIKNWIASQN